MSMRNTSLDDFRKALSSKAPVPGGGGASALAGALGASLGAMVGALTLGKPKYALVAETMTTLTQKANELAEHFLSLIDEDAEAFLPLSRAYAIPRQSPGRSEEMERCLRLAAEPPMKMVRLCCETIALLEQFAALGSTMVLSDAAAGAALCRGALWAAAVNVKINTKSMTDRSYAGRLNEEADALAREYSARADAVYHKICQTYS